MLSPSADTLQNGCCAICHPALAPVRELLVCSMHPLWPARYDAACLCLWRMIPPLWPCPPQCCMPSLFIRPLPVPHDPPPSSACTPSPPNPARIPGFCRAASATHTTGEAAPCSDHSWGGDVRSFLGGRSDHHGVGDHCRCRAGCTACPCDVFWDCWLNAAVPGLAR